MSIGSAKGSPLAVRRKLLHPTSLGKIEYSVLHHAHCGSLTRIKADVARFAPRGLRQHRKEPNRELPKVGDVDVPVAVVIEIRQVVGLPGARIERVRKDAEVGDID